VDGTRHVVRGKDAGSVDIAAISARLRTPPRATWRLSGALVHFPDRPLGRDVLPDARDGHPGREPRRANQDAPLGDGARGLPRALGRGGADRRGGGAPAQAMGLRALPARGAALVRRRGRRTVRAPVRELAAVSEDGPWGFSRADETAARYNGSSQEDTQDGTLADARFSDLRPTRYPDACCRASSGRRPAEGLR
jgi:hypothetical protein